MTKEALAWIIDDDQSIRWVLEKALQHTSIRIESYAEAESPLRNLRFREPQVIITDIRMPGLDGLDFGIDPFREGVGDVAVEIGQNVG